MRILICSDGTSAADNAIDLAALLAGPLKAEITLLGIVEKSSDERPLREALEGAGAIPPHAKCTTGDCRASGRTDPANSRSNIKNELRSRS